MRSWFFTSLIVLGILAVQDILHRYLMKLGYNGIDLVVYGLVPTVLFIGLYVYIKKIKLSPLNGTTTSLYLLSGILSFYGFLYLREAQIISPNIGYVTSIAYSSVLITILLTSIIFKDHLDIYGLLGSLFIVLGIFLISNTK